MMCELNRNPRKEIPLIGNEARPPGAPPFGSQNLEERRQRVRRGRSIIPRIDPTHHAETTDVVDVGHFKPKEAEVCKINPMPAILVRCKVRPAV